MSQAAVDDIGRVIDATGIECPILVGWSLGATLAVRYAAHHPGRVGGLVLIDGAYPIAMFVVGTGAHSGATEAEMHGARCWRRRQGAQRARVRIRNDAHKHTQILNKAPDTVVAAIEDVIHESS